MMIRFFDFRFRGMKGSALVEIIIISMKNHESPCMSEMNRPSVNDIIKNLFSLLAFKYKNHDVYFTSVVDNLTGGENYLTSVGSGKDDWRQR